MADEGYKISYSDIIQPDDSINRLIDELATLNKTYAGMADAIKKGAADMASSLKAMSGATSEGRKRIDETAISASRLERAQKELAFALSDTGKQVAWLKAQTSDANRTTVEQQRYIKQAISSYNRLKSDLKENVELYKALTQAEREDAAYGGQVLNTIIDLTKQIQVLDANMKNHINSQVELQKAQQKLAFLQSEEGQQLLKLKARIADVTQGRQQQAAALTPVEKAEQRLQYTASAEAKQLAALRLEINEKNRVTQLEARINANAEGSYNRLAAQYELNKIKLNGLRGGLQANSEEFKRLQAETKDIYEQMSKLQQATGRYTLNVGRYKTAFDGFGFSVAQVVREMPSLAVSANQFFLAISNNIPIMVDELKKLKAANAAAIAEGKAAVPVWKSFTKALLGWNTVMVVVLSLLATFGSSIIDWASKVIKGKNAVISTEEVFDNINKKLKDVDNTYASNIVSLKKLQSKWNELKTVQEKNQFIKDNQSEFNKLGVSIKDVHDAENLLINQTSAFVKALQLRAEATAAQELATEKYKESFEKAQEAKTEGKKTPSFLDKIKTWVALASAGQSDYTYDPDVAARQAEGLTETAIKARNRRIQGYEDEAEALRKDADAYFEVAKAKELEAAATLKSAGIREKTKEGKTRESAGRQPRDLTEVISRNQVEIRKRYEESVTKLITDEYAKRRKAAADEITNANDKLRRLYNLNEKYVANVGKKYRALTEEQKTQIAEQQTLITNTIANNQRALELELNRIKQEQLTHTEELFRSSLITNPLLNVASETGENKLTRFISNKPEKAADTSVSNGYVLSDDDLDAIKKSLIRERDLREDYLIEEYKLILADNKALRELGNEQARSEEEIIIEFEQKRLKLFADYDKKLLVQRQQGVETQLELVEKGSDKELELLKKQNKLALQAYKIANALKAPEEQETDEAITAKFGKKEKLIIGQFELTSFEQAQEAEKAKFDIYERTENDITLFTLKQEKERWEKQIALAKSGGLDWSKAQIKAAEATVRGINEKMGKVKTGFGEVIENIGKHGLAGGLLGSIKIKNSDGSESPLFNDEALQALQEATSTAVSYLSEVMQAETDLAQAAVDAANTRVEAAQSAVDAEIEARNNGYANNVATAKKELAQEKKRQREKEKLLEQAQKRQVALDSVIQASSLITASANIWSSMSKLGIAGPILAGAAIAAMWTSFAAAKIKARQVTLSESQEEYGEGGLEFLEGGSHASGNDIDLGVKNHKKKRMRAEGGEALAIINKRNTQKYRKQLPSIIESLNKGVFEDKYSNAFAEADRLNVAISQSSNPDLSRIENGIDAIRKQNELKCYTLSDGTMIVQEKNVKRIIKN